MRLRLHLFHKLPHGRDLARRASFSPLLIAQGSLFQVPHKARVRKHLPPFRDKRPHPLPLLIREIGRVALGLSSRYRPSGHGLLFVNGFGGTPSLELYLMYEAARRILNKRGVTISRSLVGSYVTSLDMAGCSITLTMLDENLTALWDEPVHTAALRW